MVADPAHDKPTASSIRTSLGREPPAAANDSHMQRDQPPVHGGWLLGCAIRVFLDMTAWQALRCDVSPWFGCRLCMLFTLAGGIQ